MRIDVLARRWGGPDGGPDGMAVAAAFLAWTLCELGHDVRGYTGAAGPGTWSHPRLHWRRATPIDAPEDFTADLVVTTVSGRWPRLVEAAEKAGARGRLVYWHHHSTPPEGLGGILAAPPGVAPSAGWSRTLVLPPSSWAADQLTKPPRPDQVSLDYSGAEVLVPGVGNSKGGPMSLAVARSCPELRFYALPGRSSGADCGPWHLLPNAAIAPGPLAPREFLARAGAVLSPTRAETYGLTVVEAAVRGIPVVCSDLRALRAALGDSAVYVEPTALPDAWARALRAAIAGPPPRLVLPPYAETVGEVLERLLPARSLSGAA